MNLSLTRFQRLAGACGVASPVIGLGLILSAVATTPWFSWQQNDLSDLGISATPNTFNLGLIIGGLLNVVFVIGFHRWNKPDKLARFGSILLLLGAVALTFIGLINEDQRPWHWLIAASYFLVTPLAYLFIGAQSFNKSEKTARLTTVTAGVAALIVILLRDPLTHHAGIAVPELVASLIMSSWTFALGLKLLLEPMTDKETT